jgi:hypothetical protein
MGAPVNLATPTLRLLGGLTVAAWTTAATASWAFRRSWRMRVGFVAAGASLVAGVVLPFVGEAGSGAILDGMAHGFAGLGFAAALWRARAVLEEQQEFLVNDHSQDRAGGPATR